MTVSTDETRWPEERVEAAEVSTWIATALPRRDGQWGGAPSIVHRANAWGVTARFAADGSDEPDEVIFKANFLPASFSGPAVGWLLTGRAPGLTPEILASIDEPGRRWAL